MRAGEYYEQFLQPYCCRVALGTPRPCAVRKPALIIARGRPALYTTCRLTSSRVCVCIYLCPPYGCGPRYSRGGACTHWAAEWTAIAAGTPHVYYPSVVKRAPHVSLQLIRRRGTPRISDAQPAHTRVTVLSMLAPLVCMRQRVVFSIDRRTTQQPDVRLFSPVADMILCSLMSRVRATRKRERSTRYLVVRFHQIRKKTSKAS